MEGISDFLTGLWSGLELAALSAALGGVVWALFVLDARCARPAPDDPDRALIVRSVSVLTAGAAALAVAQFFHIAADVALMRWTLGRWPFPEYLQTALCQAGSLRMVLAVLLAAAALWLRRQPRHRLRWAAVIGLALLLVVQSAWLTHAESRLENRAALMALTAVHETAGAIWVGGVFQFIALWHLIRRRPELTVQWPIRLSRFARVGVSAVAVALISAVPMAWAYVGSLPRFLTSAYGFLVGAKIVLVLAALGLAFLNNRAARRSPPDPTALFRRVPGNIEAEAGILIVILFLAASLASQPAAVDIPPDQVTSLTEARHVFAPKWPQLTTPGSGAVAANIADIYSAQGSRRSDPENNWSNFSHDVAGVFLVAIGLIAIAGWNSTQPWARHWPLGFTLLALFVFFRGSGGLGTWPFGPTGFWYSALTDAENLQHRLAAMLVLGLGLTEWRARVAQTLGSRLPYVFPILGLVGGIVLVMHTHDLTDLRFRSLIELSHTAVGVLAVFMACGRWLELRYESGPAQRAAGLISLVSIVLMGAVLMSYREPVV